MSPKFIVLTLLLNIVIAGIVFYTTHNLRLAIMAGFFFQIVDMVLLSIMAKKKRASHSSDDSSPDDES